MVDKYPGSKAWQYNFDAPEGYWPANCNVYVGDGKPAIVVTCRNLSIGDDYQPVWGEQGVIRTRSYFAFVDDEFNPISEWKELDQPNVDVHFPAVRGAEDPRLYYRDGKWMWAGTIREHHPSGDPRVCVGTVDDGMLYIVDGNGWVKNQMPTTVDNPEFIDSDTPRTPHLHGGGVFPYGDGYIGICKGHMNATWPHRTYLSQFALFDAAGNITHLTEKFTMTECPIEVATGLTLYKDELIIGFGLMDREAWLAKVPLGPVLDSMVEL